MSQSILATPALVYRAFVVFTAALTTWSIYVSIFGPYSAFRQFGSANIFTEEFWQIGFTVLWNSSPHGMMLSVALVALAVRSGAAVWLYALAVTYTVVPNVVLVLSHNDRFEVFSILRLVYLLTHIALIAWTLRYLVLKQEIRGPL